MIAILAILSIVISYLFNYYVWNEFIVGVFSLRPIDLWEAVVLTVFLQQFKSSGIKSDRT